MTPQRLRDDGSVTRASGLRPVRKLPVPPDPTLQTPEHRGTDMYPFGNNTGQTPGSVNIRTAKPQAIRHCRGCVRTEPVRRLTFDRTSPGNAD